MKFAHIKVPFSGAVTCLLLLHCQAAVMALCEKYVKVARMSLRIVLGT